MGYQIFIKIYQPVYPTYKIGLLQNLANSLGMATLRLIILISSIICLTHGIPLRVKRQWRHHHGAFEGRGEFGEPGFGGPGRFEGPGGRGFRGPGFTGPERFEGPGGLGFGGRGGFGGPSGPGFGSKFKIRAFRPRIRLDFFIKPAKFNN